MKPDVAYAELIRLSREQALLLSCAELLGWDELTYLPRSAVAYRGEQLSYLTGLLHDAATNPRIADLLHDADDARFLEEAGTGATANLRGWRRMLERSRQVPRQLVQEVMSVATTAQQAWEEARRDGDFAVFLPWLERILFLKQQEADCLRAGGPRYDALLQEFEPGMTSVRLDGVFLALRKGLGALTGRKRPRNRKSPTAILRRHFPVERQRVLVERVASEIGFDFDRGRIDVTSHPFFCTSGPADCRITTRFNASDFSEAFFSSLHELGHALFEQGIAAERYGLPTGQCQSLALHESQSRFWENGVGRSRGFWTSVYPETRELFHDSLHDVSLDQFLAAVNYVEPGVSRVRADEATYNLHIFIRYELEQALVNGALSVADLPAAWNQRYREVLGVTPADDSEGCLQDSHWSAGQFGYFPTYALGNIFAAHLYRAAEREIGDLDALLAEGGFAQLRGWLSKRVYTATAFDDGWSLVESISGGAIDPLVLVELLRDRFGRV